MPSGKLGGVNLAANTDTLLYQPAATETATVTVAFCNRNGATPALVRVAVSDSADASPNDTDYLEYDVSIPPRGILERAGIVIGSQQKIFVRSDVTLVTAVAMGFVDVPAA